MTDAAWSCAGQLSFEHASVTSVKPKLFQFSIVVPGRSHNPTLLNPDFLQRQDIVSADCSWTVAETVTTPLFAMVRYDNGVTVQVESEKLSVVDLEPGNSPRRLALPRSSAPT